MNQKTDDIVCMLDRKFAKAKGAAEDRLRELEECWESFTPDDLASFEAKAYPGKVAAWEGRMAKNLLAMSKTFDKSLHTFRQLFAEFPRGPVVAEKKGKR